MTNDAKSMQITVYHSGECGNAKNCRYPNVGTGSTPEKLKQLTALEELDLLDITFTDALWNTVVDHVTVYADGCLMFHFKNGAEMEVKICK